MRASARARVCLVGEDLDWIDGMSVQAAIEEGLSYEADWTADPQDVRLTATGAVEASGKWAYGREEVADWALLATAAPGSGIHRGMRPHVVNLRSSVPWRAGLASSACLAVAVCKATNPELAGRDLAQAAFELEANQLGRRVGPMDHLPIATGGVVAASFADNDAIAMESLPWPSDLRVLVVDTLTSRDTSAVITGKAMRVAAHEPGVMRYIERTRSLSEDLREVLSGPHPDAARVGEIVTRAHETMRDDMGVSTRLIEECVRVLLDAGCLGAKISGTGHGGCVVALADEGAVVAALAALAQLSVRAFSTSVCAAPALAG